MACGWWKTVCQALKRKRVFEPDQLECGNLRRCLNHWDLTALGLGSTLGVGVYVLIGSVALKVAGPSIVLSFLIAAVASLFAGLCYAEFGSRVPRAGSAFIYTYVTVGEFAAFIIGWNMILEALFGTASVARGLSEYVNSMTGQAMSTWFLAVVPISSPHLSPYFDFFSFVIVIILGLLLAFGVRESSMVNNVFAILNMFVILFIVIAGAFKADSTNWNIPESLVPDPQYGIGGFFPYGVWGTLKGAAICFYGFVGFDSISSSGEEVKEPRRTIPKAILTVLAIVFIAYSGVATVVTMMVPYYLLDKVASVATAFTYVGWDWARWIVSIGAVFGILASLFGAMFPLPRILYAMASDGLLFHWLAEVSSSRKSPAFATILPAFIIAALAALLQLEQLVIMMCVGTLLSYTIVAACVILLRYKASYSNEVPPSYLALIFGCGKSPTQASSRIVDITLCLFICTCVATALVTVNLRDYEYMYIIVAVLNALALLLLVIMTLQPTAKEELSFKTPLVPVIPCLSIYINIHLMILISLSTWIRVFIWIAFGIPIYIICLCCYKGKSNLENNVKLHDHANKNGKSPVQIIVESPTPPDTITRSSNLGGDETNTEKITVFQEPIVRNDMHPKAEEVIVQQLIVENNEEKEAKIIDLLDQVLQAEEDSYGEILSLKEQKDDVEIISAEHETSRHRKSLSELSDAGSDASLGNQVLSKYDVIAQVHREDLPRVNEEEERIKDQNGEEYEDFDERDTEEYEQVTAFNNSETNSRTDESGYSDTIDRNAYNESIDDLRNETPKIPVPPPLDENFFNSPTFKKSYTISARSPKIKAVEEENKPRESVQSNSSQDDGHMVFGSDKQMNFMSKLNNIFQNMISNDDDQRKRSHSTGNVVEGTPFAISRENPPMFLDLKKEIESKDNVQNLRPVNIEEDNSVETPEKPDDEETAMSRQDLKTKLEGIFANGGPQLLKPRLMKSNPPTPEESYQTDTSSTESIAKPPKIEKNDTLGRQRAKFGEVLNSFRLSLNKDDDV